ncbi:hypothetical protein VPH35_112752 [Triticum aestivum]
MVRGCISDQSVHPAAQPRSQSVAWGLVGGEPRHHDDDNKRRRDDDRDCEDRFGDKRSTGRLSCWGSVAAATTTMVSSRRSPPPLPRTTSQDIAQIETSCSEMISPPPSPRTTSRDIIKILPTSSVMGSHCRSTASLNATIRPSKTLDVGEGPDHIVLCTEAHLGPAAFPSSPTEGGLISSNAVTEIALATSDLTYAAPEPILATPTPLTLPHGHEETTPIDHEVTTPINIPSFHAQTEGQEDTPIFIPRMPALLPSPAMCSTPPRAPKARRKTLAGNRNMPSAKLALKLLCHRMGIVAEGEQINEAGRLPDIAIVALRALFRLDCDLSAAVEEALVNHGGQGGLDVSDMSTGDV